MDSDSLYASIHPMLISICAEWQKKTGCEFELAFESANIAFLEAQQNYDESRGASFSSYLYLNVYNALRDMVCSKRKRYRMGIQLNENFRAVSTIADNDNECIKSVKQSKSFMDCVLQDIGDDAKQVLRCLLSDDRFKRRISTRVNVNELKQVLQTKTGFSTSRFLAAFSELGEVIQNS